MLIRKETFQAAMCATTADDTRFYLNAVQLHPDGRVVATNGHILLIAKGKDSLTDEDMPIIPSAPFIGSPTTPVLLLAPTVARVIAGIPKSTGRGVRLPVLQTVQISTTDPDGAVTLASTDGAIPTVATVLPTDERFPNWERVIPSADQKTVDLCLGIPVLEALLKAAKITCGAKYPTPTITFTIPTAAPIVISAVGISISGADVDVTGVAMPCRK